MGSDGLVFRASGLGHPPRVSEELGNLSEMATQTCDPTSSETLVRLLGSKTMLYKAFGLF